MGWLMTQESFPTLHDRVKDWVKLPELRWVNRFDMVVPVLLAGALFGLGALLEAAAPRLGTMLPPLGEG